MFISEIIDSMTPLVIKELILWLQDEEKDNYWEGLAYVGIIAFIMFMRTMTSRRGINNIHRGFVFIQNCVKVRINLKLTLNLTLIRDI